MAAQILALHLLQAVLPSWDKAERAEDMEGLVEKLFGFLGSLLTTCSSDVPFLRGGRSCPGPRLCTRPRPPVLGPGGVRAATSSRPGPGGVHAATSSHPGPGGVHAATSCPVLLSESTLRRRRARPQASLTATHSSTLAEEAVALLRTLHSLGQWNGLINKHINAQLQAVSRSCGPTPAGGVGASDTCADSRPLS